MATFGARPSMDHFREKPVLIKLPEIVLLLIAIITYFADSHGSPAYVASVLLPCLLNSIVFMMNYVLGYSQLKHTPVELTLYVYYAIGMLISAILLLSRSIPSQIASGVFCLFLTLIYGLEIYFSYVELVNRVPLPANTNTQGTDLPQGNNPSVAVVSNQPPPAYTSTLAASQPPLETVDLSRVGSAWPNPAPSFTNPVYPPAMNYPPFPAGDTTNSTIPPKGQNEPRP